MWWLVWLLPTAVMSDGLILVKHCGEITCDKYQYCSDNTCRNCSFPCTPSIGNKSGQGSNFDRELCEKQCQDYIHDVVKHYVTYDEGKDMQKEVREEMLGSIEGLRAMVALSLTLSLLVGVAMLTCLGFAWLKYRRLCKASSREKDMMEKKISTVSGIVNNNKDCGGNGIRPMDLPPASTAGAPSVVTTTTPISTRHPSEDATLEYAAYDNPGMTPSPVLAENRGETSF
ncbi:protein grindelwald isoform X2 [Halyomorpha halys]|uniref:protein grindelwald isoform X2 n=1 Tax=Halyomorpha halys TaxID=286706 RepID=UPI0006D5128D|nr:protein grindelwald isoform X1 [Halyomorpha halys]